MYVIVWREFCPPFFISLFKKDMHSSNRKRENRGKKKLWALYRHCCAFGSSVEKRSAVCHLFLVHFCFWGANGWKKERTNERMKKKKKTNFARPALTGPPKRMATGRKRSAKKEKDKPAKKTIRCYNNRWSDRCKKGKITEKTNRLTRHLRLQHRDVKKN